jgi:hypothetical protein
VEAKDRPDFETADRKAQMAAVEVVRDVAAGIQRVRGRGTRYLPKHGAEDIGDWKVRLDTAVLFNGVRRTIDGLAGMVFRRDLKLSEDVNKQIAVHLENIDNAGTHIDVFARGLLADALEAGHAGILIDVPRVENGGRPLMQSEERALGVRPYWVHVRKEDTFGYRTAVIAGETVLTQLVIRETSQEPDGEFGQKEVVRYRVLQRTDSGITWKMLRIDAEADKVVVDDPGGTITNQTEIPFVPVFGKRTGYLESSPPLLDLAETNLAHYRLLADHLYAMHLANIPVGVLIGVDPDFEIELGPNAWLKLPINASFKWEAHDGANFDENREQLREFKADMAAMGLSLLQIETRQAETEVAKRMNRTEQDSALASTARSLQDALEMALIFHGKFMRVDKPGTIEVNRDFENQPMTPDEIREWRESVAVGQYSVDTMWAIMAKRGALPDDFDPEVERQRIATGGLEMREAAA